MSTRAIVAGSLLLAVCCPMRSSAQAVLYTNEAAYLAALASAGYGVIFEGFEDDGAWSSTRTPFSASQVSNDGILWSSNFAANAVSTSGMGGGTHGGSWGLYSNPHGDQNAEWRDSVCDVPDPIPEVCFLNDGFLGTSDSAGTLYGVGGWIDGTYGADVVLILDGVVHDFGAAGSVYPTWSFLGVVDPGGFSSFEYREIDGKGGQAIYIFGDDFLIGVASSPALDDCGNGTDDDGDGLVDSLDPGCVDSLDLSELDPALPCDDGADNDGDGLADFRDADGDGISDPPGDPGCWSPESSLEDPACQNGVDDDGQPGTDYDGGESVLGAGSGDPDGADPDCLGTPWRNSERPRPACGLGLELAPILTGLIWLQRRRRSHTVR